MRFLVELYLAPGTANPTPLARDAADETAQVVESIGLPADETLFLVVEADEEACVTRLMQRAGLHVNRISRALTER